jgi:pilus assembly protein Flp/PilA
MLFVPHEDGQGLVEYALILVFVAVVVFGSLSIFGDSVADMFVRITEALA